MKKILFSVLGLSPQILTETLYVLMKSNDLPDEVHVLTTQKGAELCKRAFFQESGGWFNKFCEDWKVTGIEFSADNIHTISDQSGEPLADIRLDKHNTDVANQIVDFVRNLTADDSNMLHVSIAGGRKTMGFYAGYTLSMFGRNHDKLSHVLVEEEFEGHPEFFYPTPNSKVIRSKDRKFLLECQDAKVELAYLPFISMRNSIPNHIISQSLSFNEMVELLQQRVFDKKVLISPSDSALFIDDKKITLSPANFVFYYWLAKKSFEEIPYFLLPTEGLPSTEYAQEYINCIDEALPEVVDMDRTLEALKNGMDKDFIRDRKSQIKTKLVKTLGVNAEEFLIKYTNNKTKEQGLNLQPGQIEFI